MLPPPLALTFHGVADVRLRDDPHRLFISAHDLRGHIGTLRGWGYELLTFSEWTRRASTGQGEGCATLTFDDGFADNLHTLLPLLLEVGAPATVFVVSGWMGQPHPDTPLARILDADEVRALHRNGVEIGAHTLTHADLSTLDEEGAYRELRGSRDALEELLGAGVTAAAYPYGRAGPATLAAARRAGFEAACRVLGKGAFDEPLNMPRQDMGNRSTTLGLRLKRDERYIPLMRNPAMRAVRRARMVMLGNRRVRGQVKPG